MIIHRTKTIWYKGKEFIDLRSYEVEWHLKNKKTARVVYQGKYLDLPPKKLRYGKKIDPLIHQMRYHPYGTYTLLSYEWLPVGEVPKYKLLNVIK